MQTINFCLLIGVSLTAFCCLIHNNHVSAFECGRVNLIRERIKGGNVALRSEWPFIAAIYETTPLKYICGGTLISNKNVLTAAHCIRRRDSPVELRPVDVEVLLGAYNLTEKNETGVTRRSVSEIYVHSDWVPYQAKYDADIAILVLSENVTFTHYIQPVCMPAYDDDIDGATINVRGTVVGWGLSDRDVREDIPRQMIAEALNNSNCYREDPGIISSSSNRSFCAKGADGSPNKGDSGGGFFVISRAFWVQYGIVSAIRTVNLFAVYTNVKEFKKWIVEKVTQSDGEVSEPSTNITLVCSFSYTNLHDYACGLNDLDIRNEHIQVVSVTGEHREDRDHDTVGTIVFESGLMYALPNGLGKIFRNVKYLQIGNVGSPPLRLRHIGRESLKGLENLNRFFVLNNEVKELDEDSLWDLPNLSTFHIIDNKLKAVHEKTFGQNRLLRVIYMDRNELERVPDNLFRNNSRLEVVQLNGNALIEIGEQLFRFNTQLKVVTMSSNRLESLPQNLLANRIFLRRVDFSNNLLQTIDEKFFATNFKLRDVTLSSNKLQFLPQKLFENNLILALVFLDGNLLTTLDERTFVNNAELNLINVTFNQLEHLPRNLFQTNLLLTWIDFSHNPLVEISEKLFSTNRQLNMVLLKSMKLQSLPGKILKNATVCTAIDVSKNSLTTIDERTFESHSKLQALTLSFNRLESLGGDLFKNNVLLEVIMLHDNSLRTLPANIFATNEKLESINLSFNRLESVPSFRNCLQLKYLYLSDNALAIFDERTLQTNFELKNIDLSSNRLESLPKNLFRNNFLLETIDLGSNAIKEIDEQIFAANSLLSGVNLRKNLLESLPRNLFENNLSLTIVSFDENSLKTIAFDFSKLKHVMSIQFNGNVCVSGFYDNVTNSNTLKLNEFRDLKEFQNALDTNCSVAETVESL